jgi:ribosomal protein L37AE/L43A
MAINRYTIPGKPPLMVSEADQDRCRKTGAKTLSRSNRVYWKCDLCDRTGKGLSNLTIHRRKTHGVG